MRVLVTRPQPGAGRTAARLAGLGHDPIVAPLLEVRPTGEPAPAGDHAALLVTSAQAVPFLSGWPRGLPVYAVGERTAERLREAGFEDVRPGPGDAAGLARSVARALAPPAGLLHVAGRDRKAEPTATLARAGFRVRAWTAYEARALAHLPEAAREALAGHAVDAVLHFSRRTAALLLQLVEAEGIGPALARPRHLCLSADVAEPLAAAGLAVAVAARPEEAALLSLLDRQPRGSPASPETLRRC